MIIVVHHGLDCKCTQTFLWELFLSNTQCEMFPLWAWKSMHWSQFCVPYCPMLSVGEAIILHNDSISTQLTTICPCCPQELCSSDGRHLLSGLGPSKEPSDYHFWMPIDSNETNYFHQLLGLLISGMTFVASDCRICLSGDLNSALASSFHPRNSNLRSDEWQLVAEGQISLYIPNTWTN